MSQQQVPEYAGYSAMLRPGMDPTQPSALSSGMTIGLGDNEQIPSMPNV